tara:strand:+ start:1192 stop:2766 length:1575 start_codon:yes stop_codon:yes gene_type:complete
MALPQFSRNYTRSGAYENPITPVDTKSGAIWANAIQGIGNTVARTLQTLSAQAETKVKQTQKILDENAKFVLTENNAFIANASKAGLKNPSFAKAGMDIIRLKSQAYFDMKAGKEGAGESFTKYSSKLGELIELGKAGIAANESYNSDYITNYANVNTPGGISTTSGLNPSGSINYNLAMPVRIGGTKNPNEEWYLDDDDNIRIKYTSDQITAAYGKGEIENAYIDTNPIDLFSFDAGKIDDIRTDINKFYNQSGIVKEGKIGKGYYNNDIQVIKSKDGKTEYNYQTINPSAVAAGTSSFISAKSKSYLKRPAAALNVWNHILDQGKGINNGEPVELELSKGTAGTAFTPESSKIFTEAMSQYAFNLLPKGNQGTIRRLTPITSGGKDTQAGFKKNYLDAFTKDPAAFYNKRFSIGQEDSTYKDFSYNEKTGFITLQESDREYEVEDKKGNVTIELEEQEPQSFNVYSPQGQRLLRDIIKSDVQLGSKREDIISFIDQNYPTPPAPSAPQEGVLTWDGTGFVKG